MNKNKDLGYFEYKKQKMQTQYPQAANKFKSRFGFMFKIFVATFIVIFIILVIAIMKFSSRVDIEYSRGEVPYQDGEIVDSTDDEQYKIDNRLLLIQQEENAPSEARIISKEKAKNEVIDASLLEESQKIEKAKKLEEKKAHQKELLENEKLKQNAHMPALKPLLQMKEAETKPQKDKYQEDDNITVTSKVMVGRFADIQEAKETVEDIKTRIPDMTPFVRKMGDVYGVQMGSYKDFIVARNVAQKLKAKGLDVWIYQQ